MSKVKKFNGKLVLLIGTIICLIASLCFIQIAHADVEGGSVDVKEISDTNESYIGEVRCGNLGYLFKNYQEFNDICYGNDNVNLFKNEKELTINVYENFNFHKNTCDIKDGRTFKFIIEGGKWLFTTDGYKMFNVENGNLILNGKNDENALITEAGNDNTITVQKDGHVEVNHITFREPYEDKSIPRHGGIFYFDDLSKDQAFNNCTFYHNKAKYGGSIYVNDYETEGNNLVFNHCNFDGCSATSQGGAIHNDSKYVNLEFNETKFENCSSDCEGGTISTVGNHENVTFNNCAIDKCSADQGGAIYNYSNTSDYRFNNTKITNCHSNDDGGAIYSSADNENYYFDKSSIESCNAKNKGGAIYVRSSYANFIGTSIEKPNDLIPTTKLHNTSFITKCNAHDEGNITQGAGGAIYTDLHISCGNHVTINGLDFIENHATQNKGGAICAHGQYNSILNCTFVSNKALDDGQAIDLTKGGFWSDSSEAKIYNCEFYNNYSSDNSCSINLYNLKANNMSKNRMYYKDSFNPKKEFRDDKNWIGRFSLIKIV